MYIKRRWKREHIRTLERINRLNQPKRNPQVGDIVLVKYENTPRTIWTTGRGISTEPETKVFVRSVILKHKQFQNSKGW